MNDSQHWFTTAMTFLEESGAYTALIATGEPADKLVFIVRGVENVSDTKAALDALQEQWDAFAEDDAS